MLTSLVLFVAAAISFRKGFAADCYCGQSGAHFECGNKNDWDVTDSKVDGIAWGHSWENACDACARKAAKSWANRAEGGKRCYYCRNGFVQSGFFLAGKTGIWLKSSGTARVTEDAVDNIVRCGTAGRSVIEGEVDFDEEITSVIPKYMSIVAGVVGFIAVATAVKYIMHRKVLVMESDETSLLA